MDRGGDPQPFVVELSVARCWIVEAPRWIRHPSGQWAVAFQLSFRLVSFVFGLFFFFVVFLSFFVVFVVRRFSFRRFRRFLRCLVRFRSFSSPFRSFSFVFCFCFVPFAVIYWQLQGSVRFIML